MIIEIETIKKPIKGDILYYDGKEWKVKQESSITKELKQEVQTLNKKIDNLVASQEEFKVNVATTIDILKETIKQLINKEL